VALKPQGNNLVAGTALAIAQIQSPGFVTAVSGWIIRQDGSAEFNNVTIRGGVVIGGTSLTYNGAPAAGNLVSSVSGTGGTDTFGNLYLAGTTGYTSIGGTYFAAQLGGTATSAAVNLYSAASYGGPWTQYGSLSAQANGLLTINAANAIDLTKPMKEALVAAQPGSLTFAAETWHAMPALNTHFSNGSPAPAYKLNIDNTVSFAGDVTVTTGTTSGTVVTLPTSFYFPITTKKFAVPISAGTPATAANVQVTVDTSGNIILSAGPTGAGYSFALDVVRYPIDY
jgi:hypothetical protein